MGRDWEIMDLHPEMSALRWNGKRVGRQAHFETGKKLGTITVRGAVARPPPTHTVPHHTE